MRRTNATVTLVKMIRCIRFLSPVNYLENDSKKVDTKPKLALLNFLSTKKPLKNADNSNKNEDTSGF